MAAVVSACSLELEISATCVLYVYYVGLRGPSSGLGIDSQRAA